jgi:ferredoxin
MNIALMLRQIAAGQHHEAMVTVRRDIALPAVLGWVCPAPCEKNCRRRGVDEPVAICLSKRFAGESRHVGHLEWGHPVAPSTGKQVAIVGGGPAGLACAVYLRLLGHECIVIEAGPAMGGMLRNGIREFRLPRSVLDADIDAIRRTGVEFRCNVRVGADVSLAALREQFDAVVLATGTSADGKVEDWGVERTERGIRVKAGTFQTEEVGLFAVGGAVAPLRMAVRACADGKAAAWSCHLYLSGLPVEEKTERFDSMIGKMMEPELREFMKSVDSGRRVELPAGSLGFSEVEAVREARRCMHCDCRKTDECSLRRMADRFGAQGKRFRPEARDALTLTQEHGEVVFETGKCIRCGLCVRLTEKEGDTHALTFAGRGSGTRVIPPLGVEFQGMLENSAAVVVEACPTGALAWKRVEREDGNG